MSGENENIDGGAKVIRILDPSEDLRTSVVETLEAALEDAREIGAIAVAVVLVGSEGEVPTSWAGPSLQLMGAVRILDRNVVDAAEGG